MENRYNVLVENLKKRGKFKDFGLVGEIILICILGMRHSTSVV
jgi:hypothetical protein